MMRKGTILLCLPATLACISANVPEDIAYKYCVGPFVENQPISVLARMEYTHYDEAKFHLKATFLGNRGQRIYETTRYQYRADVDEDGYYSFFVQIPSDYVYYGARLHLEFYCLSPLDATAYHGKAFLVPMDPVIQEWEGIMLVDGDVTIERKPRFLWFDSTIDPDMAYWDNEAYATRWVSKGKNLTSSRRCPLSQFRLEYYNPYMIFPDKTKAELRLQNYLEDFKDISVDHGGYRSIDLKVMALRTNTGVDYLFSLAKPLYFSEIDYRASTEPPIDEPSFRSTNFYFPLREGHDAAMYRYQIYLKNLGPHNEEMMVSMSSYSDVKKLGPCQSADYCVVIGTP